MKYILLLLPFAAIAQDCITTTDGNLKSSKYYCLSGSIQNLNFENGATLIVMGNLTVGNINGTGKRIHVYGGNLTVNSSLNLNGKDSVVIYGGRTVRSKSVELQNGNNVIKMNDGSSWAIDGDLQLLDNSSTITQCASTITVNANYNVSGAVSSHDLCECALLDVKGVLNVNKPNVIDGMGFVRANGANMNQRLTNSPQIGACLPTNNIGAAYPTCATNCTILSLPNTQPRPQQPEPIEKRHYKVTNLYSGKTVETFATILEVKKAIGKGAYLITAGNFKTKIIKL